MSAAPSHQDSPAARDAARADVFAPDVLVHTPVRAPVHAPAEGYRRGSWLLASAWQRMGVALAVCACLWALTGWAMGWW
ncbi:hypothetical protein [Bordetella sp. LUAb4]|uniref:hypothetical protein n=1 Tax=Bordetella sp. LUAb4 TaxID=2843195 RepID=UPI001E4B6771|nr:hypothetical protein [Bordetella sp. LUAb4]